MRRFEIGRLLHYRYRIAEKNMDCIRKRGWFHQRLGYRRNNLFISQPSRSYSDFTQFMLIFPLAWFSPLETNSTILFDSLQLRSIPPLMSAKDSTAWLVNSSCGSLGVIYTTQSEHVTRRHACKAADPSVLGLVLVFQTPFWNGIWKCKTRCVSWLDKYSRDIQWACSLASRFVLADTG